MVNDLIEKINNSFRLYVKNDDLWVGFPDGPSIKISDHGLVNYKPKFFDLVKIQVKGFLYRHGLYHLKREGLLTDEKRKEN